MMHTTMLQQYAVFILVAQMALIKDFVSRAH